MRSNLADKSDSGSSSSLSREYERVMNVNGVKVYGKIILEHHSYDKVHRWEFYIYGIEKERS